MIEGRHTLSDVVEITDRCGAELPAPCRGNPQHALGFVEGIRLQHHGVHDAEDRGCGADADGQCQHRCDGKARPQPALTERKGHVLAKLLEPLAVRNRAIAATAQGGELGSHSLDVTKPADGFGTCGVAVHSAIDEFLRPKINVVCELIANLVFDGHPP